MGTIVVVARGGLGDGEYHKSQFLGKPPEKQNLFGERQVLVVVAMVELEHQWLWDLLVSGQMVEQVEVEQQWLWDLLVSGQMVEQVVVVEVEHQWLWDLLVSEQMVEQVVVEQVEVEHQWLWDLLVSEQMVEQVEEVVEEGLRFS
uniref:Uncharacterized protein n=1 Tax=Knipowitschia caucasica TaxID=637954 RepID=A0AAV2JZQ9_KNICA